VQHSFSGTNKKVTAMHAFSVPVGPYSPKSFTRPKPSINKNYFSLNLNFSPTQPIPKIDAITAISSNLNTEI